MNEKITIEIEDEQDAEFIKEVGAYFSSDEMFGLYVSALLVLREEFGTSLEECHDEIQYLLREINGPTTVH